MRFILDPRVRGFRQKGVLKKRMVNGDYDDYQDDPRYSLDPRVRDGERFGKEEF